MEKQLVEHLEDWVDEMVRKKFTREDIAAALEDKAEQMREEDEGATEPGD